GLVHEEFHGRDWTRRGGTFQMVQLWVNLPASAKTAPPRYQSILASQIPTVALPNGGGTLRVIAGAFGDATGPAKVFTPINVWDLRLTSGRRTELAVPDGHTTALVVLAGAVRVDGSDIVGEADVGLFDRTGERVTVDCVEDTTALLLSGQPI